MSWRIDSLGISSSDLAKRDHNPVMSNYGSTWRFAKDENRKQVTQEEKKEIVKEESVDSVIELDKNGKMTEEGLNKLSKNQLAELAASLGIVDPTLPKNKLIYVILSKQK